MHGYYGNVDGNSDGCDKIRGYVGLIETLFLKTEGSTLCYETNNEGIIVPKLDEYEYMENGQLSWEAENVLEIQRGALQFITDYCNSKCNFLDSFSYELTFHNLESIANNPSMNDVKMFSDFRFFNNGTVSHLAKTKSLLFYIFHPRKLKKDFYESRWRIGFMKGLFKIWLPYQSIMNIIMKFVKKGN
jgi:hypothetical protein